MEFQFKTNKRKQLPRDKFHANCTLFPGNINFINIILICHWNKIFTCEKWNFCLNKVEICTFFIKGNMIFFIYLENVHSAENIKSQHFFRLDAFKNGKKNIFKFMTVKFYFLIVSLNEYYRVLRIKKFNKGFLKGISNTLWNWKN